MTKTGHAESEENAGHEYPLDEHQGLGRARRPLVEAGAEHRPDGDGGEHHRQHQREHRTKSAEQHLEVPEPDHLDAHRREAGDHQGRTNPPGRADGADGWRHDVHGVRHLYFPRGGTIRSPARERIGAGTRNHIQDNCGQLGGAQANGGDEPEVGEERAQGGASRIDGVKHGDLHRACRLDVVPHAVPDQQRQRAAHQRRDWKEQRGGDRAAGDVRHPRELEPAAGVGCVRGHRRHECRQARHQQRDRQAEERDDEFDGPVRANERVTGSFVMPIGPHAGHVAAEAETQHEDADDDRSRVDRVPEDIAELARPDDLVDEAAEAGTEEENVEDDRRHDEGRN